MSRGTPDPLVSIIVPIYNNIRFLPDSFASLFAQTYRRLEIIAIDDGSSEPVVDLLRRFVDPRLTILRNPSNLGPTKTLNIGLDAANGDLIGRHDSDDISVAHRIERQVARFVRPSIGLVTAWARNVRETYPNPPDPVSDDYMDRIIRLPESQVHETLQRTNCLVGPTMIHTRDVFKAIGYYDETLYFAQDYNYALRIAERYSIAVVQEDLYVRRVHARMSRGDPRKAHHKHRLLERVHERALTHPVIRTRGPQQAEVIRRPRVS